MSVAWRQLCVMASITSWKWARVGACSYQSHWHGMASTWEKRRESTKPCCHLGKPKGEANLTSFSRGQAKGNSCKWMPQQLKEMVFHVGSCGKESNRERASERGPRGQQKTRGPCGKKRQKGPQAWGAWRGAPRGKEEETAPAVAWGQVTQTRQGSMRAR